MLEVVMGLLAAVDGSAIGDLLARPRAYRLTEVVTEAGFRISNLTEVVTEAGFRVANLTKVVTEAGYKIAP
jgi:hypothetical protein